MSTTDAQGSEAPEQAKDEHADDPRYKRARAVSGGDKGREMLEHAAQGAKLDEAEEISALDYLLGSPSRAVFDVEVQVSTPAGDRPVTFVVQAQDGKVIERIENAHRNENTGVLDSIPSSAALVAEATEKLVQGGREVSIRSPEFLTMEIVDAGGVKAEHTFADPSLVLMRRFTGQQGLIVFVANEIRRVSGFDPSRVAIGKRRLVKAALD